MLVVTADIGIAQQYIEVAVFDETFGIGLFVGHGLGSRHHAQGEDSPFLVQHLVFPNHQ